MAVAERTAVFYHEIGHALDVSLCKKPLHKFNTIRLAYASDMSLLTLKEKAGLGYFTQGNSCGLGEVVAEAGVAILSINHPSEIKDYFPQTIRAIKLKYEQSIFTFSQHKLDSRGLLQKESGEKGHEKML